MQQCVKLTDTNDPKHLFIKYRRFFRTTLVHPDVKLHFPLSRTAAVTTYTIRFCFGSLLDILLVIIDEGKHTFPSRTRSLSPRSLMVVQPRCCVRVSCCQSCDPCLPKRWHGSFLFLNSSIIIISMGNLKKKRRLKMNKHKRRKRTRSNRHKKKDW